MNITVEELKSIIAEEIQSMVEDGTIDENILDRLKAQTKGIGSGLAGAALSKLGAKGAGAELMRVRKAKQATSILQSYAKKVTSVLQGIEKDILKLEIDPQDPMLKPIKKALQALRSANTSMASQTDKQLMAQDQQQTTATATATGTPAPAAAE